MHPGGHPLHRLRLDDLDPGPRPGAADQGPDQEHAPSRPGRAAGAASPACRWRTRRSRSRSAAPCTTSGPTAAASSTWWSRSTWRPGWHEIGLSSEGSEESHRPTCTWSIRTVEFGVVSDIDDTVMVTALPRPLLAAWHTFVVNEHARSTTPGMPVLYERLIAHHPGAPVDLPVHRRLERRPDPDPLPVPQPLPRRGPAADRVGADRRPLVPQRPGPQAHQPGTAGAGVPRPQVAADRRRRSARPRDLRRLRQPPSRARRGGLHPSAEPRRGGAGRQPACATTASTTSPNVPWLLAPDGAAFAEQAGPARPAAGLPPAARGRGLAATHRQVRREPVTRRRSWRAATATRRPAARCDRVTTGSTAAGGSATAKTLGPPTERASARSETSSMREP